MTTNLTICQDIIRYALEQHRSGNKFALLSDSGIPSRFFPSMEALEECWYAKPFDDFFEGFEANTSAPVRGSDWAYASEQAVELYDRLLTPIKTGFLIVAISRDDLDADIVETCEALKTAFFESSMA
jgi:hypothetical protein